MKNIFLCLILVSCVSGEANNSENKYVEYLPVCSEGCQHLSLLKEEADGELSCIQSRTIGGKECKITCAEKMASGNKIINPKCWTTLKTCGDFEEVCNLGDTYP